MTQKQEIDQLKGIGEVLHDVVSLIGGEIHMVGESAPKHTTEENKQHHKHCLVDFGPHSGMEIVWTREPPHLQQRVRELCRPDQQTDLVPTGTQPVASGEGQQADKMVEHHNPALVTTPHTIRRLEHEVGEAELHRHILPMRVELPKRTQVDDRRGEKEQLDPPTRDERV